MAEPPADPAQQAAPSAQDVLLATKLHVPRPQPGVVPRPRLAQQLDDGLGRGLVLLCAPAGYGKTVLLADWAQHGPQLAAWLSLDSGDNDPARFWRHAIAALDRVRPGIGERVAPLLGPPAPQSFDGLVTALINELAEPGADDVRLVLDDYHTISAQPVHTSLEFLLEHRPPGLELVLASRSDPPLSLARLRARGQLTELRAADLRFTAGEAAALLQQVAPGELLPDAAVTALASRTEGWAAGLQLAALSLRGQPDVDAFVAAFTGSHRYVLDYLAEEVLERQPARLRTFLLETSVLERLSGALCDAVTGRPGSQALLEQIERDGLFLVPLDEVRNWWRYHHLFADLLRARLEQEPGQAAELHRRAAAWYEEHGLPDDAIRHATAAGEMLRAARLIERHFDTVYSLRGEGATIQRWLSALPHDLIWSRPRLLLTQAQVAATGGRLDEVEPLLEAAERAAGGGVEEAFEPAVGRAGSLLVNIPAHIALHRSYLAQLRGDAEGTAAFARQALGELHQGEWMLNSTIQGFLAVAEWLRGQLAEAERAFVSSLAGWQETDQLTVTVWAAYSLAQVQRGRGRLEAAARTSQRMLDITGNLGRRARPAAGLAHVSLADVAYQRDELDSALHHVSQGIPLCRQWVYALPLASGLVTLAWVRQATGDPAGAMAAMSEAGQVAPGAAGLLNPVPAQRARLLLAQGERDAAARWAEDSGLEPDDEPRYPDEPGYLVLARVLLAQDEPGRALSLLDRLHTDAAAQDRTGSLIEVGALRALALAASGAGDEAVAALARALRLACPQGLVRVFADEGPPMAALLGRLITAQRDGHTAAAAVPLGCLARLRHAFAAGPAAGGPGPAAAAPGIIEPLTTRELEVLAMLADGRSNQAIAADLVITLDTVKKHVSHVLGKLGAANRTEAVARARELGQIP